MNNYYDSEEYVPQSRSDDCDTSSVYSEDWSWEDETTGEPITEGIERYCEFFRIDEQTFASVSLCHCSYLVLDY